MLHKSSSRMTLKSRASLTKSETESFDNFVEQCREQGLLPKDQGLQSGDCDFGFKDEATLLRFLQGRSFDVAGAVKQFGDAQKIREAADTVKIYESISIGDFEQARAMYPHWTGRRDKSGRPICLFDLASLDQQRIASYSDLREKSTNKAGVSTSTAMQHALVFGDYMTRFAIPMCNAIAAAESQDCPVMNALYLVDISCMTVRQSWSLRDFSQDFTSMLATCYPEVVERIYILNAPSYFGMIWGILKRMTDPRTAEKLTFVSSAVVLPTLLSGISIDNIPAQFGGKHNFTHGQVPSIEKDVLRAFAGIEELPSGPIKFAKNEQGDDMIMCTGTGASLNELKTLVRMDKSLDIDFSEKKTLVIADKREFPSAPAAVIESTTELSV